MATKTTDGGGAQDRLVTRFDPSTLETIDRLAERDGRTRAEVLQAAVREYIAKNALPGDNHSIPLPKGG